MIYIVYWTYGIKLLNCDQIEKTFFKKIFTVSRAEYNILQRYHKLIVQA